MESAASNDGESVADVKRCGKEEEDLFPLLPNEEALAVAQACAEAWEDMGGLPAALQVLRSGCPQDSALLAAKALGALVDKPGAALEIDADKGVLRSLLQVFNFQSITSEDAGPLNFTMKRLAHACPSMPAQMVASCNDPDSLLSSAGLACVKQLLACPQLQKRMLDAGAAGAFVAALSHPSACCRSAACFIVSLVKDDSELLPRLLDAGIIPALMEVAREGPALEPGDPDDSNTGIFAHDGSLCLDSSARSFAELAMQPALCACYALVLLLNYQGSTARMLDRTPDLGVALMRCLHGFRDGPREVAATLLWHLLVFLTQQADQTKSDGCREVLCRGLLREGLPEALPELIRPEHSEMLVKSTLTAVNLVLDTLGGSCIPREAQEVVAGVLLQYIGRGGTQDALRSSATSALSKMTACAPVRKLVSSGLPDHLVYNMARVMVTGTVTEACHAMSILVHNVKLAPTPADVMLSAGLGGFVPGVFRLAREAPLPSLLGNAKPGKVLLEESFKLIAQHCEGTHLLQAIKLGLLKKMEALFRTPTNYNVTCACTIFGGLLRSPGAMEAVREAKLMPDLLLQAIDSNNHGNVVTVAALLHYYKFSAASYVVELLKAGVLEALKEAREKVRRHVGLRMQLGQMINSLEDLVRLHPAEVEELQARARGTSWPSSVFDGETETEHSQLVEVRRSRSGRRGSSRKTTPAAIEGPLSTEVAGFGSERGLDSNLASECSGVVQSEKPTNGDSSSAGEEESTEPSIESGLLGAPLQPERVLAGPSAHEAEEPSEQDRGEEKAGTHAGPHCRERHSVCAVCQKRGGGGVKLQACAACGTVMYCGRDCQRQHWPQHKAECRAKQAE